MNINIILVSGNLAKTRTISLTGLQLSIAGLLLIALAAILALGLLPRLSPPSAAANIFGAKDEAFYLRESLNKMAAKVGQMQAQLHRLDALGERLVKLAGLKPQEFLFDQAPGAGGPFSAGSAREINFAELGERLDALTRGLEQRSDRLSVLDAWFTASQGPKQLIPSALPVQTGWYSSNFGWRLDPFNGQNAFHEGIDFMAEPGTPVSAAAGGVVAYSDYHPQYGNMIEVDHGNGLATRYAHLSKRGVKTGTVVKMREQIGEIGNTGRSTGTHLHFEVRQQGAAQNPVRFLQLPG